MLIRQGLIEELDIFMAIVRRASQDLNSKNVLQWDEIYPDELTVIDDINKQTLFCYEQGDKIMGIITLNEEQAPEYDALEWQYTPKKILVVHRICVDPSYQGKGIGKALMQYAEEYAKEKGYETLRLDAFIQNPISCSLYEKIGYKKAGVVTFRKGQFYCYEKSLI